MGSDHFATTLQCPVCQTPLFSGPLLQVIHFPDDADQVMALITGDLNRVICSLCGTSISCQPALAVVWDKENEIAICRLTLEELSKSPSNQPDLWHTLSKTVKFAEPADYDKLRVHVLKWLDRYVQSVFAPLFAGTQTEMLPPAKASKPYQAPLALLALLAQLLGKLPPRLVTKPPLPEEEQRKILGDLFRLIVVDYCRETYTYAYHNGGIARLLELLEQRIPRACFTSAVLHDVLKNCVDWKADELMDDLGKIDAAFRAEYINAAVHAVADVPNPRELQWALMMMVLVLLSRIEQIKMSPTLLLTPNVLKRCIRFQTAWNLTMSGNKFFDSDPTERLDLAGAYFRALGMEDLFAENFPDAISMRLPEKLSDDQLVQDLTESFGKTFDAQVTKISTPEQATKYWETIVPSALAQLLRQMLDNGRHAAGLRIVDHFLATLREKSAAGLGWSLIRCAEVLNQRLWYNEAASMLAAHTETVLNASSAIPCLLRFALLNEGGNTFRYWHQYAQALSSYRLAERLAGCCEEVTPEHKRSLDRNVAIVLREMGRYAEAIRIFEQVLDQTPVDDADARGAALLSIARAYAEVNRPTEAIRYATRCLSLASMDRTVRISALIILAKARSAGTPGAELSELSAAFKYAENNAMLRVQVSTAILALSSRGKVDSALIERARIEIEKALEAPLQGGSWDSSVTAATILADWYVDAKKPSEAARILQRVLTIFGDSALPWQLLHSQARATPETDVQRRWKLMRRALTVVETKFPQRAGLSFAASWISDKDRFQEDLLATFRSALSIGLSHSTDALDICEFISGREISAAVDPNRELERSASAAIERIHAAPATERTRIVVFVEHADTTQAVVISRGAAPVLIGEELDSVALREAGRRFRDRVRFQVPGHSGEIEEILRDSLIRVGGLLSGASMPGEHLCIVPSPALLALPIHAAREGGGELLLRRNTISTIPNLFTLAHVLSGGRRVLGRAGLCLVNKQTDVNAYVVQSTAAAHRLAALLGVNEQDLLVGLKADKSAAITLLNKVDAGVFLCHGADSGVVRGRGICVSDGSFLPPGLLPVSEDASLRRFLLDAVDLDDCGKTPAILVLVACSAGYSTRGAGGTKVGLERSLFAHGTRTIVAPLWDVEQRSALEFVEQLTIVLQTNPDTSIAAAHQAACLALADRYGELFRWGPFSINGNWT